MTDTVRHAFLSELEKIAITIGYGEGGVGGERSAPSPVRHELREAAPRGKAWKAPGQDLSTNIRSALAEGKADRAADKPFRKGLRPGQRAPGGAHPAPTSLAARAQAALKSVASGSTARKLLLRR